MINAKEVYQQQEKMKRVEESLLSKFSNAGGNITGDVTFDKYLNLKAWPGYGSGEAKLWYNGTSKVFDIDNATDINVGGHLVYHQNRKPTCADIGALQAGNWSINESTLTVDGKKALVSSGVNLYVGYGSDYSNIITGAGYKFYHEGHKPEWAEVTGKPTEFTPVAHNHDDMYFTESEVTTKLTGKAPLVHYHDFVKVKDTRNENTAPNAYDSLSNLTEFKTSHTVGLDVASSFSAVNTIIPWTDDTGGNSYQLGYGTNTGNIPAMSIRTSPIDGKTWGDWYKLYHEGNKPTWNDVENKPSTFAPSAHNHDDRYFTEAEINSKLTTELAKKFDKTGGTLTGNINYEGGGYSGSAIQFVNANLNGAGLKISAGALTMIGGGEACETASSDFATSSEKLVLASDEEVYLYSNLQEGLQHKKVATFKRDGQFYIGDHKVYHQGLKPTWNEIESKPATFPATAHNHDDRYFTEAEVTSKLESKFNKGGGTLGGDLQFVADHNIVWNRNTDSAKIGFKNDSDSDADSYVYFETGDNGNEYFKFRCKTASASTDLFTIKSDNARFKTHQLYHEGHKPNWDEVLNKPDLILSTDAFKANTANSVDVRLAQGDGRGIRFWDDPTAYKISMSSASNATHGGRVTGDTTSDFNMYFAMKNGNKGFVFKTDNGPIAGITSTGDVKAKGNLAIADNKFELKYNADTESVDFVFN